MTSIYNSSHEIWEINQDREGSGDSLDILKEDQDIKDQTEINDQSIDLSIRLSEK